MTIPCAALFGRPAADVAGKARLHDFALWKSGSRNSTALRPEGSIVEPTP